MQIVVKRLLLLAISMVVFLADRLRHLAWLSIGKEIPATSVVLYYHSIPKEKRSAFARQMDELIRWSKPVPADTRRPLLPPPRCVAVTFDDGYQNNIDNAVPELAQRGIPATFFVVTEALGGIASWTSQFPGLASSEPIMTAEQLRKLPFDLIQVGSHTQTHRRLTQLSEQEARRELSESRRRLSEIIKSDVRFFCFPYGAFDDKLIAWCREEGYERVFTSLPHSSGADEFVVGRIASEPDDWPLEFRLKLFGAYRWRQLGSSLKQRVLSRMKLETA